MGPQFAYAKWNGSCFFSRRTREPPTQEETNVTISSVAPKLGRGFAGGQVRTYLPFPQAGANAPRDFTHMLVGVACGALAVCGVQLLMVIKSEVALSRSVEAVSE
jgi:hypothetical protein